MSKTKIETVVGKIVLKYTIISSPVGRLMLIGDENGLSRIQFETKEKPLTKPKNLELDSDYFQEASQQLNQYFQNKRTSFDLKLNPKGTEFQLKVWQQLQKIPYGSTATYLDLALTLKNKNYCRAVGGANNKNPLPIVIPCHRVIGKNGDLVGFAGGLNVKKHLLELESK